MSIPGAGRLFARNEELDFGMNPFHNWTLRFGTLNEGGKSGTWIARCDAWRFSLYAQYGWAACCPFYSLGYRGKDLQP